MPRPKTNQPLQKHTVLLFEGDFARLGEIYPDPGATVMLRYILRKHLERFDETAPREIPNINVKGLTDDD